MRSQYKPLKDEVTNKLRGFDFPNLLLAKAEDFGFHFRSQSFTIEIPESRLNSDDFELGLAHELTEGTLRKLIFPIVNSIGKSLNPSHDSLELRFRIHEATILSLERYEVIADQWDILERDFEKALQDNLNKMPASQKKISPSLESKENLKSKRT